MSLEDSVDRNRLDPLTREVIPREGVEIRLDRTTPGEHVQINATQISNSWLIRVALLFRPITGLPLALRPLGVIRLNPGEGQIPAWLCDWMFCGLALFGIWQG